MAEILVSALVEALFEVVADRLVAAYKMENLIEVVTSIVGLAFMVFGGIALWFGWI